MDTSAPVILLTVDTVRADKFTEDCFPQSLQLLRDDFVEFSNAYSQGNGTPFAFPAIITGHPVVGNGQFPDDAKTIASLFDGQTTGFSNNGHVTHQRGYNRGFSLFHDQYAPDNATLSDKIRETTWLRDSEIVMKCYNLLQKIKNINSFADTEILDTPGLSAEKVTDYILRRVKTEDEFIWGHYMDPHTPYSPDIAVDGPEVNRTIDELRRLNDYQYETQPHPPEVLHFQERLYESNIRYFDRELARLLRELKDKPWYDDALIILTADHGELFGEHGCMFHPGHIDPVDELLRVPLLVKYPNGEDAGTEFSHLVQHGDIIATIAEQIDTHENGPPETVHPLRSQTPRTVISKSNTAIRLTEPDTVGIKRRDGTSEGLEDLSTSGKDLIEAAEYPVVESMSGEAVGVEEAERRKRLRNLGYQ